MEALVQQVFAGLASGGIYASVALALVMIYQSTHHINFAQGEMAMFSTYIAWALVQSGWPYWWAFLATVLISFVGGLVIQRVILRPVEKAPILTNVIVFIGLLVIFNSLAGWIFDHTIKVFPSPFPKVGTAGGLISGHDLGSIAVMLGAGGLVQFFPLHFGGAGDARRGAKSRVGAAGRDPRLMDAGAGLGIVGCDRRGGRHDGGAGGLSRPQHDGRHLALRICRRASGRNRQSMGSGAGRVHRRRA